MSVMAKTVKVSFPWGHVAEETWAPTDAFCPKCGHREVWEIIRTSEATDDDLKMCAACGQMFKADIDHDQPKPSSGPDGKRFRAIGGSA